MGRLGIRIIAALQIVGAVAGLLGYAAGLVSARGPLSLNAVLGAVIFALSVLAGVLLWQARRWGYLLSFIIQTLQVPCLALNAFSYRFVVGIALCIGLRAEHIFSGYYFGGIFNVSRGRDEVYTSSLNIIAVGTSLYLAAKLLASWRKSPPLRYGTPPNSASPADQKAPLPGR